MSKHFIGMAGIHGCPATCDVYDSVKDAAESLASLHERGDRFRRELQRNQYAELRPQDGNEYCEISECECSEPEIHSDSY